MGTVYAFFADGFEEIEAFTAIDTLRRAGLNVEIVSVTPDEIVVGAHDPFFAISISRIVISLMLNFCCCREECRELLHLTSTKDCAN